MKPSKRIPVPFLQHRENGGNILMNRKKLLSVLFAIIIVRIAILIIWKQDPVFYLSPRNFNGRGLLTQPFLIDFLLVLIPILVYFFRNITIFQRPSLEWKILLKAVFIIVAPFITGLLLWQYVQDWYFRWQLNSVVISRYVLYLFTFLAIQWMWDDLKITSRWVKGVILILILGTLAITQDIFTGADAMITLVGLFSSVGITTAILSIGLRRDFVTNPAGTFWAVALVGLPIHFFIFSARSDSYFTVFLPALGFWLAAVAVRKEKRAWVRTIQYGMVPFLALLLSVLPPLLLPPQTVHPMMERKVQQSLEEVQVGSITVRYGDKRVKKMAMQLARVIEAANTVSKQYFGISPEVTELVIYGFAPGGFHGEFPHRIVGNFISEQYVRNCEDSLFLNSQLSPHFPDPVNGILHEYSHLFGMVPYWNWIMGPEEEGWATYAATVLSKLIAEQFGEKIWRPAYPFAEQAEKITRLNLSGKAVIWSHPYEFGGFQLWYKFARDIGEREVFRNRWKLTRRDLPGITFIESIPEAALNLAKGFGIEKFRRYGDFPPVKYEEIYSSDDLLVLAKTAGIPEERMLRYYSLMSRKTLYPAVRLPE